MTFWEWLAIAIVAIIAFPTLAGGIICIPFYGGKILSELQAIGRTLKGHGDHLERTDVRLDDHERRITRIEVRTESDE